MITYTLASLVIILSIVNLVRIVFFMIGSDLYTVKQVIDKKRTGKISSYPTFTVVIPAHNEEHTVINSIKSVVTATYPKDKLHVIVVDDGSTDKTVELVKNLINKPGYGNIQLIEQKNSGKARALNNALNNYVTSELVMCLDADSTILPDALINAAYYFIDEKVVALSSNVKIRNTGTLLNLIQQFEYLVCYQMKRAQTFFNVEYIVGGIGSTFRYSAIKKVGFYDTDTITEDIDLTMKLLRNGNKDARAIYGSDVITYTESVLNVKGLIQQRFRWKHGRSQTFLKNTQMFFSSNKNHTKLFSWIYLPYALLSDMAFFLEPLVLGYIAYVVINFHDWVTLISAFVVVGTYITMNVIAEDTLSWKQRVKFALLAPIMYFCFYLLSFVEYVALVKSYSKYKEILANEGSGDCNWEHVSRVVDQNETKILSPIFLQQNLVPVFAVIAIVVLTTFGFYATSSKTKTFAMNAKYKNFPITHVVQEGEYLRGIAKEYYNDESAWTYIQVGGNPDLIYPGDKVVIRDLSSKPISMK